MAGPPDNGTAAAGEAFDPAGDGQGSAEQGSIFDPYLQSVPEDWGSPGIPTQGSPREVVSNYLKDAEKNVNAKLSDAAQLQKQFGDYKDIDLSGITPEQMSNVVAFVKDVGSSPEAYQEWLRNEATEAGLLQAQEAVDLTEPGNEEQDLETYIQARIDQALNSVTQKLSQFEQSSQEKAEQERQVAIAQHIESSFEQLEKANNIKLSDEQQEAILALSEGVEGDDYVEQGFAKLRALEGGAQANLVNDKASQPAPSLRSGGQPAPAKPKTFADVRGQALEMINQAL